MLLFFLVLWPWPLGRLAVHFVHEGGNDVHGEREDDGGVLLRRDGCQRLEIAARGKEFASIDSSSGLASVKVTLGMRNLGSRDPPLEHR